jgi:hypothetical protein
MSEAESATRFSAMLVLERFDASTAARHLLSAAPLSLAEGLEKLLEAELYPDAVRYVACCLPIRAAIWWGCLCCWAVQRSGADGARPAAEALDAVVRWLQDPSEEHRRAAQRAGQTAGAETPAGALALAAFWSTGSMSEPDLPEVAPPPNVAAQTVAGAVMAAAAVGPAVHVNERFRRFLGLAFEVANGQNRWE